MKLPAPPATTKVAKLQRPRPGGARLALFSHRPAAASRGLGHRTWPELGYTLAGTGLYEANYQGIAAKLPRPYLVYLPHFASGCSRQRLEAAQHFFAQPEHAPQGTERELAKVSDQVLDCMDLREHELAAAMHFWLAMTTTDREHKP